MRDRLIDRAQTLTPLGPAGADREATHAAGTADIKD
jgi:hypothetical protein